MGDYRFEEVREEHVKEILEIYNYYIIHSTATFHVEPLKKDEMRDLLFYDTNRFKSFVILDNNSLCGYMILGPHSKREAFKHTGDIALYLHHNCVGKGIGYSAIEFLEKFAQKNDFHVLHSVICSENEKSIKLFTQYGYQQCGNYPEVGKKFDRWLDLVVLQKTFPTPRLENA